MLGLKVPSSSWFQLNTATMQLYGVAIKSIARHQSMFGYRIQATNSRGISNTISFKANIDGTPYTSDCEITMNFVYNYMTENIVNVDIIRTFISLIQEYFGESGSSARDVKILSFTKIQHSSSYSISWSHCAFRYTSRQLAMQGLTVDDRDAIAQIFAKYVVTSTTATATTQIVPQFKTFMSSYFTIQSMSVSYDCIEEPPIPQTDKIRVFPKFCQLFNDSIPSTTFHDKSDGNTRNLRLTLLNKHGVPVTLDHWLQLDEYQNVYGVVTEKVKNAAPLGKMRNILRCHDKNALVAGGYSFLMGVFFNRDIIQYTLDNWDSG